MHFFYLDESGDTGGDLLNPDQRIFVLGGISLRDEGWNQTKEAYDRAVDEFFNGAPPANFELHTMDLLSPNGEGAFAGISMAQRTSFAKSLLDLIKTRKHGIHFIAFDKVTLGNLACEAALPFNHRHPYPLAFDYAITLINWYVKERLGRSARGMIIVDQKEQYHDDLERIVLDRRSHGPKAHRVKWIVEVTYPVDSRKNPMIQISDLVVYCIRRFLEVDAGLRDAWPPEAKRFYAECYEQISSRVARQALVARGGAALAELNTYLAHARYAPRGQWRRRHGLI